MNMKELKADQTRDIVREHYAKVATGGAGCAPGCCSAPAPELTANLGYTADQQAAVPEGANLGLGCGNPTAIASLRTGETVLDLGAGGGFDSFIAARQVGPTGRVIGVDMTPEMVSLARKNAAKIEATNVEFRLGEIEHLPVADASIDAILSNCVVNLSPEKDAVYREALRVLKPGGRIVLSDVVATAPIPQELQDQAIALAGCIAGAAPLEDVRAMLTAAGFVDIQIDLEPNSAEIVGAWLPGAEKFIASAKIEARRPGAAADPCCAPGCCA
jgi:SAM-dependent methyltransferase